MTQQERERLAAKLYNFLYPKSNFYKLDIPSVRKYEEAAEKFAVHLNTLKEK